MTIAAVLLLVAMAGIGSAIVAGLAGLLVAWCGMVHGGVLYQAPPHGFSLHRS